MKFLCIDFINSSWYITHKLFSDPLTDAAWILKFAAEWDIKSLLSPSNAEVEKLIIMRCEFSKLLLRQIENGLLTSKDIELVNSYMVKTRYYKNLSAIDSNYKLANIPEAVNWEWFMSEIAASFCSLLTSDRLNNLKICQNPECGWFFIDTSKSGTKKWCDDTCATLMKVRRFRKRQKEIE